MWTNSMFIWRWSYSIWEANRVLYPVICGWHWENMTFESSSQLSHRWLGWRIFLESKIIIITHAIHANWTVFGGVKTELVLFRLVTHWAAEAASEKERKKVFDGKEFHFPRSRLEKHHREGGCAAVVSKVCVLWVRTQEVRPCLQLFYIRLQADTGGICLCCFALLSFLGHFSSRLSHFSQADSGGSRHPATPSDSPHASVGCELIADWFLFLFIGNMHAPSFTRAHSTI